MKRVPATSSWPPPKCPKCEKNVQSNSGCAWCMHCGWALNRYLDPSTGRKVERQPGRW